MSHSPLHTIMPAKVLFWGQPEVIDFIPEDKRFSILADEVHDWVSSFYRGETVGTQYALKMASLTTGPTQKLWNQIYSEEVDHQCRLADWLLERGLAPLPPNRLMKKAFEILPKLSAAKAKSELIDTIMHTQIFFEHLGNVLSDWRLPHINDRELKAVLYRIHKDETKHISAGQKEVSKLRNQSVELRDIINHQIDHIFPYHLGRSFLNRESFSKLRKIGRTISERVMHSEYSRFRPVEIVQTWEKVPGYYCYACSPTRLEGLKIEPKLSKEETIWDTIQFNARHEGMNGIVHGGFISMALDEMMGYYAIFKFDRLALTTDLKVRFFAPVSPLTDYRLESSIDKKEDNTLYLKSSLVRESDNQLAASASGKFMIPNRSIAIRIFGPTIDHPAISSLWEKD